MSSSAESRAAARWDGLDARELSDRLALPNVVVFQRVGSTMDVAHSLGADGAPAGTLVLAEAQSAGRGRQGRAWSSEPAAGIWLTLIERPSPGDPAALEVLSIRIGLSIAPALEPFAPAPVRLKWPNDVYAGERKLGGILIEARWRGDRLDWVAIGVGINVRPPLTEQRAAGLRPGLSRVDVLGAIVPSIRAAVARTGSLTPEELAAFGARDLAAGRRCAEPVAGRVLGIGERGALLVETTSGAVEVRAGSLVFQEER